MPRKVRDAAGSVKEFLERVWDRSPPPDTHIILYRGQFQDLALLPKLSRSPNPPKKVQECEPAMLRSLKNVTPHLRPSQPGNDWDFLSLGQHHGMSTRMSDWSANP